MAKGGCLGHSSIQSQQQPSVMSSVSLALEFINLGMQSQLQQSSLRESVRGWQLGVTPSFVHCLLICLLHELYSEVSV